MNESRPTFDQLRNLLQQLGFEETLVPREFISFRHEASGTDFFLPVHRSNQHVAPHHLAMFRMQLDAKGLMDADEFDRRIASAVLGQTA